MIEPLAIEKYCDSLKDKIVFTHFSSHEFINGEAIKNLTQVPQINSFIIREIFKKWKEETQKLKSPFFDFEHEEVKDALGEFMNALSFHIKIDKDRFEYLLKDALKSTFEYLENPVYFLQEEVFNFHEVTIPKEEIKKRFAHLKLYPNKLKELKEDARINSDLVRLDQIMTAIEDVFESADTLEAEKQLIQELDKLVPNNFVSFREEPPLIEVKLEEAVNEVETDNTEEPNESSLNDSFEVKNTDGFSIELSPIDSLDEGVTLHQKYYFTKELFNGKDMVFEKAIREADHYDSYDDARDYLLDLYAQRYDWDEKEEAVSELFSLLNRKF